ncbi:vWA domain-containing protein [Pseudaestuariivita sp.]|uniref:vWA domain-containing protein n=1 Tax=Pseudaestuariivita sp. TaxID=2211669 RepID=UPI00405964C5
MSCLSDAMLVFDGSASMAETGDARTRVPRIVEARAALARALPQIAPVRRVGLLVYGPNGTPGDGPGEHVSESVGCRSIDLRFAPASDSSLRIISEVDRLVPGGSTPLTASVAQAAAVLDFRAKPGVIVLVTDGKETCGGAPCALAQDLALAAADLTVHVIGFRVRAPYFDWESGEGGDHETEVTVARCLSDLTGGTYTSAETVDDLVRALDETLGCPVVGLAPLPQAPFRTAQLARHGDS